MRPVLSTFAAPLEPALSADPSTPRAYVALSRCRTPAGMKVEGFRPGLVMAHPTVMAYYDRIALGLPL